METVLEQVEQDVAVDIPDIVTHIVNPPDNLHIWKPDMEIREVVSIAVANGLPLKALCGYVWVPKSDPDKHLACSECVRVAGELMREAGE